MIISNNEFPILKEYVLCKVTKYVELNKVKGAYCNLVHYNNIEALLLPSEATRNKYQRIEKIHKIGSEIICEVYNIDDKHIDLSYKTVSEEIEKQQKEKLICLDKLWRIIEKIHKDDLNIKELLFWSNDYSNMEPNDVKIKYENYLSNPKLLFENNTTDFDEQFINDSVIELNKYIQITPYSVLIEFNLFSIHFNGVENIKTVLHNVFDEIKQKYNGRLELHSLPTYNIIYDAQNKEEIIDIMNIINNNLIKESNEYNCIAKINTDYKIIHERKFNLLL